MVPYQQYAPIVRVVSLLFWITASFWLPLLFILEGWRHLKSGFRYSADYWSMVFPLGMYTVASLKVGTLWQTALLVRIAQRFIFIALIAWLVVFLGMLYKQVKVLAAMPERHLT